VAPRRSPKREAVDHPAWSRRRAGGARTREALTGLVPLRDEPFSAEQARIVRALVGRVVVGPEGADTPFGVEAASCA